MTALSTGDAARDVAFLEQIDWVGSGSAPQAVVEAPPYADSPFRSLLSANGDGLAQDETGSEVEAARALPAPPMPASACSLPA